MTSLRRKGVFAVTTAREMALFSSQPGLELTMQPTEPGTWSNPSASATPVKSLTLDSYCHCTFK